MRYILNPYIALRSWTLVPYAYYIKGERNAKGLTAEEFAFLTECDGRSELRTRRKARWPANSWQTASSERPKTATCCRTGAGHASVRTAISQR